MMISGGLFMSWPDGVGCECRKVGRRYGPRCGVSAAARRENQECHQGRTAALLEGIEFVVLAVGTSSSRGFPYGRHHGPGEKAMRLVKAER